MAQQQTLFGEPVPIEPDKIKDSKIERLQKCADLVLGWNREVGMPLSSRGWAYIAENKRVINKEELNSFQKNINDCRKEGLLPIHFTAEDAKRSFDCVEEITAYIESPEEHVREWLNDWEYSIISRSPTSAFWQSQDCYIQMIVEKIDLKTLFKPLCQKYHISVANGGGWSDINLRGYMAERFKQAEKLGKIPVLLYCGDHDPAGLLISKTIKKNLADLQKATGWNPEHLKVDRFGLNFDFIQENNLVWIDNLTSGKGKPPNMKLKYVSEYVEKYGERKVEANALITSREAGIVLCEQAILKHLGKNPLVKWETDKHRARETTTNILEIIGFDAHVQTMLDSLKPTRNQPEENKDDNNTDHENEGDNCSNCASKQKCEKFNPNFICNKYLRQTIESEENNGN